MSSPFRSAASPRGKFLKFPSIGTEHVIQINAPYTERQATDFQTKQPKYFPSGDPIMEQWVSGLDYNAESEEDAPSVLIIDSMAKRAAVGRALEEARADDLAVGGVLTIKHTGFGVARNGNNPPKEYEASYVPPQAGDDTWGSDEA